MASRRTTVEVVADWSGLRAPTLMGHLHATLGRGEQVFSFEYDRAWLEAPNAQVLDPTLRLLSGPQFAPPGKENFGVFLDSSPDRWGRVLMQRREAFLARTERRAVRPLRELDYLLGVYDGHRQGGLRFRFEGGAFLDDTEELASPPWTSLRELEQASLELERAGSERDRRYAIWLRMLIAPGRSLGGARPKASVVDPKGSLWIAKFPSTVDVHDVGGWEAVMQLLANRAGITTAAHQCRRFRSRHHTFLSKRFDRDANKRIHFVSAMTLLEKSDREPASYMELARAIIQHGAHVNQDLEQLWRRIVFFICVSNVDDHLRNHGLLLARRGWTLAPAYDINPVAAGDGLTLNISETDNAQDLSLALDVAPHFRIKAPRARAIQREIVMAVRTWRSTAKSVGISRSDQDMMEPAFRVAA